MTLNHPVIEGRHPFPIGVVGDLNPAVKMSLFDKKLLPLFHNKTMVSA
jgi:hypothetical protein